MAAFAAVVSRKLFAERASRHCAVKKTRYARVMSLEAYLTYVCEIPEKYNANDEDYYLSTFYQYERKKVIKLGSGTGIVFVFPANELNKIPQSEPRSDYLIDALGIFSTHITTGTKFVIVNYPSNFDHPCYQPCTFTADWGKVDGEFIKECSPCYLSFKKKDGYGRTFSVTASRPHIKEHNHYQFNGISKPYVLKSEYIGAVSQSLELDRSGKIIDVAIKRFYQSR